MDLDAFEDALDTLILSDAANYGDCASMERLHQLRSRFDAFVIDATAAFEVGEEWAVEGAKTASSWIASHCRVARRGDACACLVR